MSAGTVGPCGLDCLECPYPSCIAEGGRGPGQKRSPESLARARERGAEWRKARAEAGICLACGKAPASSGRRHCDACRARIAAQRAAQRAARLAAGLCATCGRNPARPGLTKCAECAEKGRASRMRSTGGKKDA